MEELSTPHKCVTRCCRVLRKTPILWHYSMFLCLSLNLLKDQHWQTCPWICAVEEHFQKGNKSASWIKQDGWCSDKVGFQYSQHSHNPVNTWLKKTQANNDQVRQLRRGDKPQPRIFMCAPGRYHLQSDIWPDAKSQHLGPPLRWHPGHARSKETKSKLGKQDESLPLTEGLQAFLPFHH